MAEQKTIKLFDAIAQMRELSARGETFSFKFRKWNRQTGRGGDLVIIRAAKMRPKATDEDVANSSHKLFFVDADTGQQRVCWQPLIVEFNGMRTVLN